MVAHETARQRLVAQYDAIPAGAPVRLAKRTSNLFRPRDRTAAPGLDVSGLDSVLSVDPVARTAAIGSIVAERSHDGEPVDFLDGTVFTADEAYLTLGSWADQAPFTSDYTGTNVYYRSIQQRTVDYLTVRDYLWRWDTDWFWC